MNPHECESGGGRCLGDACPHRGGVLRARRWIEFVSLYIVIPLALGALRGLDIAVPVLPILWVAAYPAARYLVRHHGWGVRELAEFHLSRSQGGHLLLRVAVAAALLAGGLFLVAPCQLFELPRANPRLWALVMVCYPILSVYPQGLLYRGLFYARYANLFRSERGAWLAGAAVFSLAHVVFGNVWAVALTFVGGLFINRTYRRTGSMLVSDAEHAAYGQLVFTLGWGRYLYHGTVRLLEHV